MRDIDLLLSVGGNIAGKTLCAFGDAAATPALTTVKHFREEFEEHIERARERSDLAVGAAVGAADLAASAESGAYASVDVRGGAHHA